MGRVIRASKRQVGNSNLKKDKKRMALKPGKRISKSGKVYFEYRANRSDRKGYTKPKGKKIAKSRGKRKGWL